MSTYENKLTVIAFYAAIERGDYDAVASMCHEDFVFYPQIDSPRAGVDGFIRAEKKHLDSFQGFSMAVDPIGEGDRVAAFVVFTGVHTGAFYGIEATGRTLRFSMANVFTFRDGLISEKRAHYDLHDHIDQLTRDRT